MYTLFFDHFATVGPWTNNGSPIYTTFPMCQTRIAKDNITDGSTNTLLLSENESAGRWIWYGDNTRNIPIASLMQTPTVVTPADNIAEVEEHLAFCYPNGVAENNVGGIDSDGYPIYIPLMVLGPDTYTSPLFINEGRTSSGIQVMQPTRTARPSSGHPGVVIAAFCDCSTRPLKDDISKRLFVQLCRPESGAIINPKDLGF